MSPEELRTGIVACLHWEPDWPPTLPQFRRLCRPRGEEAYRLYRALPEPPEAREQRKAAGLAQLTALREETRYRAWLAEHAHRRESPLSAVLRQVRALMRA